MKKTMRTLILVGLGCASMTVAGARGAWAQGGSEPGSTGSPTATRGELITKSFTIEDVDHSNRTVTLKGKEGEHVTVQAPQDMQGFDKLKKGEKVDVDYYQSMAISLAPKGTPLSPTEMQEQGARTGKGAMGGSRQVTGSAKIVSVNRQENTVVLKGQNGKMQTVKVEDPELQKKLASVKPGEVVQMTYTEAVAAAIRPQQK